MMVKWLMAIGILIVAVSAKADEALLEVKRGDIIEALSRADISAMPATEFTTSTLWTKGEVRFTGVLLKDFVDAFDLKGKPLTATAINDYAVDIPAEDAVEGGPIIAYLMNGQEMSPRDKGPLWIVYPYDSNVEYQSETYYSRSIWQLNRISVAE